MDNKTSFIRLPSGGSCFFIEAGLAESWLLFFWQRMGFQSSSTAQYIAMASIAAFRYWYNSSNILPSIGMYIVSMRHFWAGSWFRVGISASVLANPILASWCSLSMMACSESNSSQSFARRALLKPAFCFSTSLAATWCLHLPIIDLPTVDTHLSPAACLRLSSPADRPPVSACLRLPTAPLSPFPASLPPLRRPACVYGRRERHRQRSLTADVSSPTPSSIPLSFLKNHVAIIIIIIIIIFATY